ncbi:hypothetical protein FH972_016099 [Carpinus fangiana]|uniref:Alpha/beta hydrolase fold-3 domain-containing protein n=1 Tax=Carpinus fangiana TaxID=176857 RepID=A0A5N6RF42_9ROSI|nr:hypothetical protein FH972_016099 [Carpinus fangiana]
MASGTDEITHDFPPFFKAYKDGRIERYMSHDHVPAGLDPHTGIQSKDVVISPETGLSARIFIPKINGPDHQKLPLLVHYHGGGFCVGSPFDSISHKFLTSLISQANIIVVSVDYRLAPEHPLPIAYDDSLAALQWIATQALFENRVVDVLYNCGCTVEHELFDQANFEKHKSGYKKTFLAFVCFFPSSRSSFKVPAAPCSRPQFFFVLQAPVQRRLPPPPPLPLLFSPPLSPLIPTIWARPSIQQPCRRPRNRNRPQPLSLSHSSSTPWGCHRVAVGGPQANPTTSGVAHGKPLFRGGSSATSARSRGGVGSP